MYAKILEFLTKIFWPFFKQYIWPIIQAEVIAIIKVTFQTLRKMYEQILNDSAKRREERAKEKAREAEEQAERAKNKEEAEKYKAIAEVWRQVAEDFRHENELLKEQLEVASQEIFENTEQNIQAIQIETEGNQAQLVSGEKIVALPAPSDDLPGLPENALADKE